MAYLFVSVKTIVATIGFVWQINNPVLRLEVLLIITREYIIEKKVFSRQHLANNDNYKVTC